MPKPTYEDADVMLRLMQMYPAEDAGYIWSDEFIPDYQESQKKRPDDTEAHGKLRAILGWYESIGTLYKYGLLNGDLLFDWLAVDASWDRVKSHALAWRQEMGNVHMYENFEAMAEANVDWTARRDRATA